MQRGDILKAAIHRGAIDDRLGVENGRAEQYLGAWEGSAALAGGYMARFLALYVGSTANDKQNDKADATTEQKGKAA